MSFGKCQTETRKSHCEAPWWAEHNVWCVGRWCPGTPRPNINGSNNAKTDGSESSAASGLFDAKKETMVLFQFWQFVKESHLVSRELTLAKINRLLNDLLDDGHDGAGDGDDDHSGVDDGSVHSPLRGPISFVKFISAIIRILIVRMRQHESGAVDAAAATAHGANNCGASEPTANDQALVEGHQQ